MDMITSCCREELAGLATSVPVTVDPLPATALQRFLVAHYERLRNKLVRRLGSKDFASECLHDTWLRLAESSPMAPVQNPEAYIYRMACNIAIDGLRRSRMLEYLDDAVVASDELMSQASGPEKVAESRSELAVVERAIQAMPVRDRNVFIALRVEEKSRQEVAAYYCLPLRTVDTALRLALDHCARHLGCRA